MNKADLLEQCKNLPILKLQTYHYGQSLIIDDSYNSNPAGFKAALKLLADYPSERKKIVITRGMLELGAKSDKLHQEIGRIISGCADELILIKPDFEKPIIQGVGDSKIKIRSIYDKQELLIYIRQLKLTKNIVLIENRIFDDILKEIKAES